MENKIVLITGGSDGIGKQAAKEIAAMGATVVVIGRNEEKTAGAVAEIKAASGSDAVDYLIADLSLMADVRAVAAAFRAKHERLDVLFNNAGAGFGQRRETAEGIEMTWALNHLAYFLLTHELLDLMPSGGRIVSTSSGAHYEGAIDFDDLEHKKSYKIMKVYSTSKLANILFTAALARRVKDKGITANCFHPGMVNTNIGRSDNGWLGRLIQPLIFGRGISVEDGADTGVYLCTSDEVADVSGEYFDKRKVKQAKEEANDEARQERLWAMSAAQLGIE